MKVKTLRKHINAHKPQPVKNIGRKYELPEREAARLIREGLVEEDKPQDDDAEV